MRKIGSFFLAATILPAGLLLSFSEVQALLTPNPNPEGNTITIQSDQEKRSPELFENYGILSNFGFLTMGDLTNYVTGQIVNQSSGYLTIGQNDNFAENLLNSGSIRSNSELSIYSNMLTNSSGATIQVEPYGENGEFMILANIVNSGEITYSSYEPTSSSYFNIYGNVTNHSNGVIQSTGGMRIGRYQDDPSVDLLNSGVISSAKELSIYANTVTNEENAIITNITNGSDFDDQFSELMIRSDLVNYGHIKQLYTGSALDHVHFNIYGNVTNHSNGVIQSTGQMRIERSQDGPSVDVLNSGVISSARELSIHANTVTNEENAIITNITNESDYDYPYSEVMIQSDLVNYGDIKQLYTGSASDQLYFSIYGNVTNHSNGVIQSAGQMRIGSYKDYYNDRLSTDLLNSGVISSARELSIYANTVTNEENAIITNITNGSDFNDQFSELMIRSDLVNYGDIKHLYIGSDPRFQVYSSIIGNVTNGITGNIESNKSHRFRLEGKLINYGKIGISSAVSEEPYQYDDELDISGTVINQESGNFELSLWVYMHSAFLNSGIFSYTGNNPEINSTYDYCNYGIPYEPMQLRLLDNSANTISGTILNNSGVINFLNGLKNEGIIINNGVIGECWGQSTLDNLGTLAGNSFYMGVFNNEGGIIKPGSPIGSIEFSGEFTFNSGKIEFDIGGFADGLYDYIYFTDTANLLAGEMVFHRSPEYDIFADFEPHSSKRIKILMADNGIIGFAPSNWSFSFDDLLPEGFTASIELEGNSIFLEVFNNNDEIPLDQDDDGILDVDDNCPTEPNFDQLDNDLDGQGDACDPDDDNDGVKDTVDACPFIDASGLDTNQDGCLDENEDIADSIDEDVIPELEATIYMILNDPDIPDSAADDVQNAIEELSGQQKPNSGTSNSGAIDKLESGTLLAALTKFIKAVEALQDAAIDGVDTTSLQEMIANHAKVAVQIAIDDSVDSLRLDKAITVFEEGNAKLISGDYLGALMKYKKTVQFF